MSKQRFEQKHDDRLKRPTEVEADTLRRVEIIAGVGRRRRFSRDTKARIVLESRAPGAVVSEVARRHGLTPQQLFGWRRELGSGIARPDVPTAGVGTFTPVVVAGSPVARQNQAQTHACRLADRGLIEIAIGGVLIRLREGVAPRMIAAVLQAVRAIS
jgi:transposase